MVLVAGLLECSGFLAVICRDGSCALRTRMAKAGLF
jgi:hypothetical protein